MGGKVAARNGILAIRWRLPSGVEIDTGFRAGNRDQYDGWLERLRDQSAAGTEDGRVFTGKPFGKAKGPNARGSRLFHRHVRLSGDADRPQLSPSDRGGHRAADRQHRLER